jgi:hypothetical protein
LGTEFGLFRFDGVQQVQWQPPTALSLVTPEKVLFRYKLERRDSDWQDAGNHRQAHYGNVSPGNYRFRVSACNNSGVWNEAGTFLDFAIDPAYYQTTWFRLSCVAAFLALLGALYQLRMRQVARQFNMRLEERVSERTRIARELHDTLLQSFQGVLMKFYAVTNLIPSRPAEAQKTLESVIEQARRAVTEGRDAVLGLRSAAVGTNDLALAISTLGEELAADQTENCPEFHVQVDGAPRDLAPLVRDEIHRIASEALRNAFRTHTRVGSKWRSDMTSGSFACWSGTTERASTPRFLVEAAAPDTMACQACTNAPNLRGVSWLSGVS